VTRSWFVRLEQPASAANLLGSPLDGSRLLSSQQHLVPDVLHPDYIFFLPVQDEEMVNEYQADGGIEQARNGEEGDNVDAVVSTSFTCSASAAWLVYHLRARRSQAGPKPRALHCGMQQ
jgi:hypothetical protein